MWTRSEEENFDLLLKVVNNESHEYFPEELKTILILIQDKIGVTQGSQITGKTPDYLYRKVKWLKVYSHLLLLNYAYRDYVNKIFNQIGYFKNGKEKKGFKIFNYLWKKPFHPSYVIGEKFGVTSSMVRKAKAQYLKKVKELIPSTKDINPIAMSLLLYHFDKCAFFFLMGSFKRHPREKIDEDIRFSCSKIEDKDTICNKFDVWEWGKQLKKLASKGCTEWLLNDNWGWQYFITLTFKDDIHPEQAEKYYRRWIRKINEEVYGKRYRRYHKSITWVKVSDYQRRAVIHFHALFSGLPKDWDKFRVMYLWENMGDKCGFARIFPFKKKACAYISKTYLKGQELDVWVRVSKRREQLRLFSAE